MNIKLKIAAAFIAGGIVGVSSTYFLFKRYFDERYDKEMSEEMDALKSFYMAKFQDITAKYQTSPSFTEVEKLVDEAREQVHEGKYTDYTAFYDGTAENIPEEVQGMNNDVVKTIKHSVKSNKKVDEDGFEHHNIFEDFGDLKLDDISEENNEAPTEDDAPEDDEEYEDWMDGKIESDPKLQGLYMDEDDEETEEDQVEDEDIPEDSNPNPVNDEDIPEKPYQIDKSEFFNQCGWHEKLTWSFYDGDKVLADETDESVMYVQTQIGLDARELDELFKQKRQEKDDEPNVVYFRDARNELDYEICRVAESYYGTHPEDQGEDDEYHISISK